MRDPGTDLCSDPRYSDPSQAKGERCCVRFERCMGSELCQQLSLGGMDYFSGRVDLSELKASDISAGEDGVFQVCENPVKELVRGQGLRPRFLV